MSIKMSVKKIVKHPMFWPLAIVALLFANVVFHVSVAIYAAQDPSVAYEDDYYEKATHWDDYAAQRARNTELGWNLRIRSSPDGTPGEQVVRVLLADKNGQPIDGASVSVVTFHNARSADRLTGTLKADGQDGEYTIDLPMRRPGIWEFRLHVDKDGEVFTKILKGEIPLDREVTLS